MNNIQRVEDREPENSTMQWRARGATQVPITCRIFTNSPLTYIMVRDWSLIAGRGGLQNGKIADPVYNQYEVSILRTLTYYQHDIGRLPILLTSKFPTVG